MMKPALKTFGFTCQLHFYCGSRSLINRIIILSLASLFLNGCTAHYPVNEELVQVSFDEGYRPAITETPSRSDELLVTLAFSGGGTRAAAFSYGVLEMLRDSKIKIEGTVTRLIDEIDSISSVSGGSFTAAYYGLFGDRIFDEFEDRFLKRDVEGHLKGSVFNPLNWLKLGSNYFGRSDMAADYYDEILFEGKTFADIIAREGPFIRINASDISLGAQFSFTQGIFDLMCSDVNNFPVSRAVAASSAVPVLFSSITLENYAGSCNYKLPDWANEALNDPDTTSRKYYIANKYSKYLDREERPYIHLYDGGLTDNLGVRPLITTFTLTGDAWSALKFSGKQNVRKILVIVVNAKAELKTHINKIGSGVPLLDTISGASSIALNEYSFETMITLRQILKNVDKEIAEGRCAEYKRQGKLLSGCDEIKHYLVEVDLDRLRDVENRKRLKQLPTSFVLEAEEVDSLRQAAKTIMQESKEFQRFLKDMN